jgi:glycosyltransferase involved in cell wall biosynthesis
MDKSIKMKILITTEQYFPIKSGVSTVVTSIAEELVNIGHQVYVVTGYDNRKDLIVNGVNIIEFKVRGGFGNFYRGETKEYIEFVKNFNCDVIINECVQTWTTDLILRELKNLKAKKFLHSHGFSLLSYKTKNPLAYIKAKLYYRTIHHYLKEYNHIFLLHDKTVETSYLNKYMINNFSYLPNGVDIGFIAKEKQILKKDNYIINISNYYPLKYQEFLLEAFYKSKTKFKLILIGSYILKDYLNRLKELKLQFDEKYGLKDVEFLNNLSRKETLKYLESSKLFLHSSKLEVFPMVIVESMAKGIPYISTNVGNVSDLTGGYVIDDIVSMTDTIDKLLEDDKLYDSKSFEGLSLVKSELNWQKIVQTLEKKISV